MKQILIAAVFFMIYCIPIYCHAQVLFHRGRSMEDAQDYLKRLHTLSIIPQEYFRVKPVMDMFYVVYDGPASFEQLHEIYPWVEPIRSNNQPAIQNLSQAILPETVSRVVMSNSQINRIVAPQNRKVKDIVFSPGKGISAQIKGRNIFVSFDIMPDSATGEHLYRTGEAELYVVLEQDLIYPLVIVPKNTHARTVTLWFGADQIKKSITSFSGMPFEHRVVSSVKSVLSGKIDDRFSQKRENDEITGFDNMKIFFTQSYTIPGEGLWIKEFVLTLNPGNLPVKLTEKMFLTPQFAQTPFSVTLSSQKLTQDTPVRLIIAGRSHAEN